MYRWAPGVGGSTGNSWGQSSRSALISGSTRLAKVLAQAILFPRGGTLSSPSRMFAVAMIDVDSNADVFVGVSSGDSVDFTMVPLAI